MGKEHFISSQKLTVNQAIHFVESPTTLQLSEETISKIELCRTYLEKRLAEPNAVFYGINTGFGSLCKVKIPNDQIKQLQKNLIVSHAVGVGPEIPLHIIKLMLLLKVQNLSLGHSGVRLSLVEKLIELYNHNILPVVYKYGSLGASGDLAPLSHIALGLIGEGEVYYNNIKKTAAAAFIECNSTAFELDAKEGLALINGTQFMSAYGVWCTNEANKLYALANLTAAISIEAIGALHSSYNKNIHSIRNQKGQQKCAEDLLRLLKDSELAEVEKTQIQDSYTFRCVPQVHGASLDVIEQVQQIIENEINAVTDNPLIFPEEDLIVSGGNFHGQPLALHLDFLKIALAELGNISERRTYKLLYGLNGLPEFLIGEPGINSGLMMPQYTAASLVSANKQLCSPASVDSITSSKGQEDHVSMGANAATQCYDLVENVKLILAIEFFTAAQALDFRIKLSNGKKSSPIISKIIEDYRKIVSFNKLDRLLKDDLQATFNFINSLNLDDYSNTIN